MNDQRPHTVITSPAVQIVRAEIEFHISGGKVRFVMIKMNETIDMKQAAAISAALRAVGEDNA